MRPAAQLSALALCIALGLALCACAGSEPPEDVATAPAAAAQPQPAQPPSELRQAMQTPIDKTHAAEDATAAAEQKRDAALDAATGQ